MIEGVVNAHHEATLTLQVQGTIGPPAQVVAVVDTGSTGSLSLRPEHVQALELPLMHWDEVTLADGSPALAPVHGATVFWDGEALDVPAIVFDSTPLVGMELLAGHDLHIEVEPDGRVVVEARGGWWWRLAAGRSPRRSVGRRARALAGPELRVA